MARPTPETHTEILAAAARRFSITGFKGTSLQDIAREVGCSKAAVLYHFANKEAILTELIAPAISALETLDARLASLTGDAARSAAITGFVELAVRFRREISLLRSELPELLQQPAFEPIQRRTERLLDALAGRSELPADRIAPLVVCAGVAAACAEFGELPDDELGPALVTVATRALGHPVH
ncbi:TetR family transcriptional regulator [Micromonospora sp. CPCC 206060]|uniref:TetR/AcrR family transcriptional regulator n=1 Tax=Micromonospora sp. CPCC 206060 TaxID=3122406 RepID=UPI002FEF874F